MPVVELHNDVVRVVTCGDDDDRDFAGLSDGPAQVESIGAGEHDVHQHQVRVGRGESLQPRFGVPLASRSVIQAQRSFLGPLVGPPLPGQEVAEYRRHQLFRIAANALLDVNVDGEDLPDRCPSRR